VMVQMSSLGQCQCRQIREQGRPNQGVQSAAYSLRYTPAFGSG
jgi:hypothetical protein